MILSVGGMLNHNNGIHGVCYKCSEILFSNALLNDQFPLPCLIACPTVEKRLVYKFPTSAFGVGISFHCAIS